MNWTNMNPIVNAVADEQGIEPGSAAWSDAGPAAYSGQTGGQGSYGWNHSAKITADHAKAIIANYGHRPCYYFGAPLRHGGYLSGGRPIGWAPEDGKDLTSGERVYLTSKGFVNVSGPDVQHFQMNPLFALFDDTSGFTVQAQGSTRKAKLVAGILIRMLMKSSAGQVRAGKGYLWGDRGAAIIVHNASRAAARDLIDQDDMKAIADWFANSCLPFYEKAPGHQINDKSNGLPTPNFQAYNGIFYLMPAFRSALGVLGGEGSDLYIRTQAVLRRWSQWCVDLDAIVPAACLDVSAFAATDEIKAGVGGKPLEFLIGKLTPDQILTGSKWVSLWAFYSAMIAEEQLGASAKPLADKMRAKWLPQAGNIDTKVYLVKADGTYA